MKILNLLHLPDCGVLQWTFMQRERRLVIPAARILSRTGGRHMPVLTTLVCFNLNHSFFYGVQGTGKDHISRARLMAAEFNRLGINVEYLFSGRAQGSYFDMHDFTHRRFATGLSFISRQGRISKFKTPTSSQPIRYAREVSALRTDRHDLVISDFEPTVVWAAQMRKTPTLAFAHQYALDATAPRPQGELAAFCTQRISGEIAPEQADVALQGMARRLWVQVSHLAGEAARPGNPDLPTRLAAA